MGTRYEQISEGQQAFIEAQKMFFVATAAPTGTVNLSPKGMDSLRVISPNRVLWLNATGSGNETAAHLQESDRMTIMFCSFEGKPMILRLYGRAKNYPKYSEAFQELIPHFSELPGARQIFDMEVELVQTSCGFAVPLMDFVKERDTLKKWAINKGEEGVKEYWEEKNRISLDGKQIKK